MRIAYVRVSTEEQNEARQREALKQYRIEKWFCEKRSAKDTNRPQLEAMLEFARSGDTIYIHDFSRLAYAGFATACTANAAERNTVDKLPGTN